MAALTERVLLDGFGGVKRWVLEEHCGAAFSNQWRRVDRRRSRRGAHSLRLLLNEEHTQWFIGLGSV